MKFFVTLAFFFIGTVTYAQTIQLFSPAEMREDVDTLVKYLEATHPNPYYRYSKKKFYQDVLSVKAKLHRSLDLTGFYLAAEPLLAKLEDGHTDFHINKFYNSQNPFIIPYFFKLLNHTPFITCTGAWQTVKQVLPPGCEIISINNVPAQKIVTDIINLNTGESPGFRADFGATRFSFYLEALYNAHGVYHVAYKSRGVIKYATIKGIRKEAMDERLAKNAGTVTPDEPNFSMEVLEKDNTAINVVELRKRVKKAL